MSSSIAIKVDKVGKCYQIYSQPLDRLKQAILPRLKCRARVQPKQYFKEFWALKDISFEVKRGETVGIIGRNGSGKSTLLQIICGTLSPTTGSVVTNGRVAALLELGSGFNPEFTGRENVYMNAAIIGLSRKETETRFADILAFADIGDFIDEPVKTYSSGMLVRLAFAVIAHVDADILIIDEALAVGDAFFTQKCMRYLRSFIETGTVLFVSHDTASVRNLCTKAFWIDRGGLLQVGSPKDISEAYLEAFYEIQQGKSSKMLDKAEIDSKENIDLKDQRQSFLNASNLRNDIQLFEFDRKAASFGKGGAEITTVQFLDVDGHSLSWIIGGENVVLRIETVANSFLDSPIIGFFVKDKLGQYLFGDNTWLNYFNTPVSCAVGKHLVADFSFVMPRLAVGDYSVTVAVANGTQEDHVQHQWIHDAVSFRSQSTSVAGGIIGVPMNNISLDIKSDK